MKHFFFPNSTNLNQLLFDGVDEKSVIDKLKRIYDAADLIYDKRIYSKKFLDSNDDLHHFLSSYNLKATFLGNKILNVPENIAIVNDLESQMGASGSKNQGCSEDRAANGLVSKIKQGLLLLWNYVTADWQKNYDSCHEDPKLLTYYYLTASNIARRLSQGYFVADNDVEKAEIWGERAIELVWHGKEIAYSHREDDEEEWRLLWLLSEFNTGVCHQDYANRNRRSNYDSAEDHYKLIFNYFHNLQNLKASQESADQMFLIYMETHRHWMTIQRRRRRSGIALQYACQFIKLLKDTQAGECVFPKEGNVADILKTDIMNDNSSNEIGSAEFWKNAKRTIEHPSNNMIENCNYSCKRVCLLSILDLARCYLGMHKFEFYKKALDLAFLASYISNNLDLDDGGDKTIVKNIDALIIISSALRKIYKHQGKEIINQDLQQFRENCMKYSFYRIDGSGEIETTPSFITELEWLADQGHLESKYEIIKWYCLLQEENWVKKSLKNNGWISSDDKLAQFTPITIKDYLQDNENNPMLSFYKGMVELHTCHYKNAIKTLEELLDKHQKYTNYIRPGTLGLKARYLLANAYMHLAEYSKAMRILKELYDTLESLSASSHESFKDERIIVDLAYCYIKKGDFDNALNTYEPVLPPTVRLLLGIKELRAKNNKRAIQIFDAVKKTAQNKADQDKNASLIKNVEILLDIAKNNPLSEEQEKYLEALKSDQTDKQSDTSLEKIKNELCKQESRTNLLDAVIAELSGLKARLRHAGVNNLLSICIFLAQTDSGEEIGIQDIARILIEELESKKYIGEFSNDTETNYLRGLFVIMTGKVREERPKIQMDNCLENSSSEDNSELDVLCYAQTCFEKSCKYSEGFISQMTPWNVIGSPNKEATRSADKGVLFNKMAYISAYLINLISLYNITKSPGSTQSDQSSSENAAYKDRIKHFIEDIPKSYVISMKAAITLAKWLITYEGNPEEKTLLYRSFSFVTIFEERGAAAFNELRTDPAFRLLRSENRGEVLAYLLAMYEPINALKEECTYGLEDKRYSDRKGLHLVQYTKLSRLKDMLKEGYPEENPNSQKASLSEGGNTPKSQLRLSNCAYVNDIFEGRRFFEYMSIFAEDNTGEGKENSTVFWQRVSDYFRQLDRDEDEMMPSASEVYTASFSIKEDSFPLWSIYGDNEAGCNIEFAEDFFDIDGGVYFYPDKLREYIPSRYIDSDYPLYIVQYIDRPTNNANVGDDKESSPQSSEKEKESQVQSCGTRAIKREKLEKHLNSIYKAWKELDTYLNTDTITKTDENVKNTVIRFAADRLNEVRFLFKDPDYAYEGEIRVVYTDEPKNAKGRINYTPDPPHQYVKMEREIKDLTIRLGSKVSDYDVDRIVSWLHKTGQVKKVVLAKRNRYVGMSFSPRSKK